MQHFSKTFAVGLQGYFYQQVTGDSGPGTQFLGDFEGRVIALGPGDDFSFALGSTHVSGNLRYFHEFDVENRLEGDAGYLNFVIPHIAGHARSSSLTPCPSPRFSKIPQITSRFAATSSACPSGDAASLLSAVSETEVPGHHRRVKPPNKPFRFVVEGGLLSRFQTGQINSREGQMRSFKRGLAAALVMCAFTATAQADCAKIGRPRPNLDLR